MEAMTKQEVYKMIRQWDARVEKEVKRQEKAGLISRLKEFDIVRSDTIPTVATKSELGRMESTLRDWREELELVEVRVEDDLATQDELEARDEVSKRVDDLQSALFVYGES